MGIPVLFFLSVNGKRGCIDLGIVVFDPHGDGQFILSVKHAFRQFHVVLIGFRASRKHQGILAERGVSLHFSVPSVSGNIFGVCCQGIAGNEPLLVVKLHVSVYSHRTGYGAVLFFQFLVNGHIQHRAAVGAPVYPSDSGAAGAAVGAHMIDKNISSVFIYAEAAVAGTQLSGNTL